MRPTSESKALNVRRMAKPVNKLKGLLHRLGQPPVPVKICSLAPRNVRKRYNATELIAQCDTTAELSEEMKAWDRMLPVGREIIK